MTLQQLKALFLAAGCDKLYAKELADNDNSKNQIYFGPNFEALNLFPNQGIVTDNGARFKAQLKFGWLLPNGSIAYAPGAQLILYPQYPEVRFSGFLQGCKHSPSGLMTSRRKGRILFLGIKNKMEIFGYVVDAESGIANEFLSEEAENISGVFKAIPLPNQIDEKTSRYKLLSEMKRIHNLGWIDSKQLDAKGTLLPCNAPQCGGFTLEAELGIPKNSSSKPDYWGWEIKQHNVKDFSKPGSGGPITLMTPEPNGGIYSEMGVDTFIRRYGYEDNKGRPDRLNFGGIYRFGVCNNSTKLLMRIRGYDNNSKKIKDSQGAIELISQEDVVTASWSFSKIFEHWSRKHTKAAYIPSKCRKQPSRQYCYGNILRLAQITDPLLLLSALASGTIYYDPGIKMEKASTNKPKIKRRSQFRIKSSEIQKLYHYFEIVEL